MRLMVAMAVARSVLPTLMRANHAGDRSRTHTARVGNSNAGCDLNAPLDGSVRFRIGRGCATYWARDSVSFPSLATARPPPSAPLPSQYLPYLIPQGYPDLHPRSAEFSLQ
jgi:hypothetical protein